MKKTLLCAALIAALSACDNSSKNDSNNSGSSTPAVQQEQKAAVKALTGAAQAEAAESRFKDLNARTNQILATNLGKANPVFKSLKSEFLNYQRGEQSSSADSSITIEFGDAIIAEVESLSTPITISAKNSIDHSDALAEQGIVAKITSTVIVDDALKARLELGDEESARIAKILDYLELDTVLFADNKVEQKIGIKPVELVKDGKEFHYEGLNYTITFLQEDLKDNPIYPADTQLQSGILRFVENGVEQIKLEPISGSGNISANGDMNFKSGAIHFTAPDGVTLHIGNTEILGEKLSFDPQFSQYLGKIDYRLNDIKITSDETHTFEFKQAYLGTNTVKNSDLYNVQIRTGIEPITDFLKDLAGISGVKINKSTLTMDFNNISADALEKLQAAGYDDSIINEAFLQSLIDNAAQNKTELHLNAAVETEAGTATVKIDIKAVAAAANNGGHKNRSSMSDEAFLQHFDIEALVRVPETIPQATGMAAMMEAQVGDFVKKEDGHYVLDFSLKNGKAMLNGQALPL